MINPCGECKGTGSVQRVGTTGDKWTETCPNCKGSGEAIIVILNKRFGWAGTVTRVPQADGTTLLTDVKLDYITLPPRADETQPKQGGTERAFKQLHDAGIKFRDAVLTHLVAPIWRKVVSRNGQV